VRTSGETTARFLAGLPVSAAAASFLLLVDFAPLLPRAK
jgi:hypothetical protein